MSKTEKEIKNEIDKTIENKNKELKEEIFKLIDREFPPYPSIAEILDRLAGQWSIEWYPGAREASIVLKNLDRPVMRVFEEGPIYYENTHLDEILEIIEKMREI